MKVNMKDLLLGILVIIIAILINKYVIRKCIKSHKELVYHPASVQYIMVSNGASVPVVIPEKNSYNTICDEYK